MTATPSAKIRMLAHTATITLRLRCGEADDRYVVSGRFFTYPLR